MKKRVTILFFLSGIVLLFSFDQQDAFSEMVNSELSFSTPVVRSEELFELTKASADIILLDARTYSEYKVSHIENAIWIGENRKSEKIPEIDKNTRIIVYCSIGYRSEKAGEILIGNGYKNVSNLWGGIFDWINKGFPVVDMNRETTENIHPYNEKWGKWITRGEKKYE